MAENGNREMTIKLKQLRKPKAIVGTVTAAICICCGGGCSWTDQSGTHHLIVGLGFGIVTTTNRPGVDVYDSAVLGAAIGPDGGGIGWMRHHRVQIDPDTASNVVISIKSTPGNLTITNYAPFWCTNSVENNASEEKENQ